MREDQLEQLKTEIRATHKDEIEHYEKKGEKIEWLHLDKWPDFWDTLELRIWNPIREFRIAVFKRITNSGVIYIAIVTALAFEALHFYKPLEEDKPKILNEYADTRQWIQRTESNAKITPLIRGFIEIPTQNPHPEQPEYLKDITPAYMQLSGLSPNISVHYIDHQ